jgi:hypothetical protein
MPDSTPIKRSVVPGGPLQDAIAVKVVSESGSGISVKLGDGTELLIKTTIVEVWRFLDAYDQSGYPIYQVRAGLVSTPVNVSEELQKH